MAQTRVTIMPTRNKKAADDTASPLDRNVIELEYVTIKSRKGRPTDLIHVGDHYFDVAEENGDATWTQVCRTCSCHIHQE
jgi:hypothetical protein